ncbi:MAG: polysaccharide biosynthesis tyrosine autokinase [Gammaproteobacteria bacterium]|nr:polysaccharide biosynthesis tyrosine autokinase [Gammaproteobacteria bacterium]
MLSTIERAMRKLSGEPAAPSAPPPAPKAAVAERQSAPPVPSREPEHADIPIREADPVAIAAAAPAPSPGGVRTDAGLAGMMREPNEVDLWIDIDRLVARNCLRPGDTYSQMAEEFQHIKRRLLGNIVTNQHHPGPPQNLIMVTSSVPGEGKTFTSTNLALSLAMEIDRRVLLVDTDIAKSDLTRLFGAHGKIGLFDVLAGYATVPEVILRTNLAKLSMIPSGTVREAVSERLASDAMQALTMEFARRYPDRIVIFDCPPVLATSGAAALAPFIGQIVMVVEAWRTPRATIKHALQMLEPTRVTGMVLNKTREVPQGHGYYYQYGYGYGYGYGTPPAPAAANRE